MRSWLFKALVIVVGLVAQPGDAWAGKLAERQGFRDFKVGEKVEKREMLSRGCSLFPDGGSDGADLYRCAVKPVGGIHATAEITVHDLVTNKVVIVFGHSERATRREYSSLVEIFSTAYGPFASCEASRAWEAPFIHRWKHAVDAEGLPYIVKRIVEGGSGKNCDFRERRVWVDQEYRMVLDYADGRLRATYASVAEEMRASAILHRRVEDFMRKKKRLIKSAAEEL